MNALFEDDWDVVKSLQQCLQDCGVQAWVCGREKKKRRRRIIFRRVIGF